MYRIFAEGIEVIKKAGVYSEETLVENIFKVDIRLTFDSQPEQIPDYEKLCDIVLSSSDIGFTWIEEWAENIFKAISEQYSNCTVSLKINKKHPAFYRKSVENVGVEFEKRI